MKLLSFTQVAIPCLVAIIGLVVLALSANIMAFTTDYFNNDTAHQHNEDARFHYEAVLHHHGYHPHNMPYKRPALLAAVGALCMIVHGVGAAVLVKRWRCKPDLAGKKYIDFAPNVAVLSINTLLLLIILMATIYAWLPDFDPITAHKIQRFMAYTMHPLVWVWYHQDTIFDPLNWFCALLPFIPEREDSFNGTVSTCRKANALTDLMIVLVLIQAIALAVHTWGFFSAKKAQKKLDEKVTEESD